MEEQSASKLEVVGGPYRFVNFVEIIEGTLKMIESTLVNIIYNQTRQSFKSITDVFVTFFRHS